MLYPKILSLFFIILCMSILFPAELLQNGNFQEGAKYWIMNGKPGQTEFMVNDSVAVLKRKTATGLVRFYQNITVTPGVAYTIIYTARTEGTASGQSLIQFAKKDAWEPKKNISHPAFQKAVFSDFHYKFVVPDNVDTMRINIVAAGDNTSVFIKNISVSTDSRQAADKTASVQNPAQTGKNKNLQSGEINFSDHKNLLINGDLKKDMQGWEPELRNTADQSVRYNNGFIELTRVTDGAWCRVWQEIEITESGLYVLFFRSRVKGPGYAMAIIHHEFKDKGWDSKKNVNSGGIIDTGSEEWSSATAMTRIPDAGTVNKIRIGLMVWGNDTTAAYKDIFVIKLPADAKPFIEPLTMFRKARLPDPKQNVRNEILPRPRIFNYDPQKLALVKNQDTLGVRFDGCSEKENPGLKSAMALLAKRLDRLGKITISTSPPEYRILIRKCAPGALADYLKKTCSVTSVLNTEQLAQAYLLLSGKGSSGNLVEMISCSDIGLYYALSSLCQILEISGDTLQIPAVKIADWPQVGLRMQKVSATSGNEEIRPEIKVLPIMKMNIFALQYHQFSNPRSDEAMRELAKKYSSKNPMPPFLHTAEINIRAAKANGNLETLVYYSPFQGDDYFDFSREADRKQYLDLMHRFLDWGARGIAIDYNDWVFHGIWDDGRGSKLPMDEAVNFINRDIKKNYASSLVIWTPPMSYKPNDKEEWGYSGSITPDYEQTLKKIDRDVLVIWTGEKTGNALIVSPLAETSMADWIKKAGRKPFLWVNVGKGGSEFFGTLVTDLGRDALIFSAEKLPVDLDRYFSGIHLNYGAYAAKDGAGYTQDQLNVHALVSADYLWNPEAWDEPNAYARAKRFMEIMYPLVLE